jgi:hypothetical protein
MEQLKDGPQELRKILAEAAENGINRTTLFAAKKALGIKSERISFGGRGGRCIWQLPAQSEEDETVAE